MRAVGWPCQAGLVGDGLAGWWWAGHVSDGLCGSVVGYDSVVLWLSNGLVAGWLTMALWPCGGLLLMGPVVGYCLWAL